MKRLFLLVALSLFASSAFAQTPPYPPRYNVSQLTGALAASAMTGKEIIVKDGLTTGDCSVGGGSAWTNCISNGTAWIPLGDGTGAGGTLTDVSATTPLNSSHGTTPNITIDNAKADGSTKGAADFLAADFNDDGAGKISIDYPNGQSADVTHKGFLSSADWGDFNARMKGSNNLSEIVSPGTSRTNLGGTTVGQNIFTATNPSAISFPKVAADNSVSFRTPAQVLSDIGAQASGNYLVDCGSNGWLVRSALNTTVCRTFTPTANRLTITNTTGGGDPVFNIPDSAQLNIAKIVNLTTNGIVHTVGGDGTLGSSLIVNADITNSTIDLTAKVTGVLPSANGGTGVNNAGTITNASNTTITGGGTIALGGFTFTVPATGSAAMLNQANSFTLINPLTTIAESWIGPSATAGIYFKAGNVGFGTASPLYPVHVLGTTPGAQLVSINNAATGTNYAVDANATGIGATLNVGGYFAAAGGTSNYAIQIPASNPGSGANNYAIRSESQAQSYFAGNIGIGNATPGKPLTVNSASSGAAIAVNGRASDDIGFIEFFRNNGTASGSIYSIVDRLTISDAASADVLTVKAGKVGIGNTGPSYVLDVNGTFRSAGTATFAVDANPLTNYTSNLGSLSDKYLTLHAAELWVETLVAQNTLATIGGRVLVAPTTPLSADVGTGDTTITVKYNNLNSGDRVYLESSGKVEFMAVTSGASGSAGSYVYSVTRNLDGSGANAWFAGDAVLNTGTTGNGFIDLYSVSGVIPGSTVGPTIVGNVRTGTAYNNIESRWAIGNLNGLYGYSGSVYGAAFGVPTATWLGIDATNGIRMMSNATQLAQWDTSGNILVGQASASKSNIYISSGALDLRVNTSIRTHLATDGSGYFANSLFAFDSSGNVNITGNATIAGWTIAATRISNTNLFLDQAGQYISGGATPPTSYGSNVGFFLEGANSGRFSFYKDANNYLQWDNSKLLIKAANFTLDSSGNLTATSATLSGAITATSGAITGTLTMSGSGSAIAIGSTPPTDSTHGTGVWIDRTGVYTLSGGTQSAVMDSTGLRIQVADSGGTFVSGYALKFQNGSDDIANAWAYGTAAGGGRLALEAKAGTNNGSGDYSQLSLIADDQTGATHATFFVRALPNSTTSYANLISHDGLAIGTSTVGVPNAMLDVRGTGIFTDTLTISNSSPTLVLTDTTASAKSLTIKADANIADFRESAGASGSLLALDLFNNRVGIGTASPVGLLHLLGGSARDGGWNAALEIGANGSFPFPAIFFNGQSTSQQSAIIWTTSTSGNVSNKVSAQIYVDTNSSTNADMAFYTNTTIGTSAPTEKMRLYGNGGLVVGSPTGGNKGAGTVNATAVYDDNVLLTDWVFKEAYTVSNSPKLFTLTDARKVTETEHRLPWMPTPAEFEKARSLGGMTTRLWQGQEQQQLYIFELNERIKSLEAKLADLEKRN